MPLYDRAAQFAAFDALAGYSDMIAEEARTTDTEIALDDNAIELLNQKLSLIADVIEDGHSPRITFTIFVPDPLKAGGHYEDITDEVKRIDVNEQRVLLCTRSNQSGIYNSIDISKIIAVHGQLVDYMDDASN